MAIQVNKIQSAIMQFPGGIDVNVTKYINLPITWESVLDETLGTARVLLTDMRQEDFVVRIDCAFRVNIPMEIRFEGQETVIRMIVARDTAEMTRKDGHATWSHNVELVDEVKLLEQEPVDNLTFKNPIAKNIDKDSFAEWATITEEGRVLFFTVGANFLDFIWRPPSIKSFYDKGTVIHISDNASSFYGKIASIESNIESLKLTIFDPYNNKEEYFSKKEKDENGKYKDTIHSVYFDETGEYRLVFELIVVSGLTTFVLEVDAYIYVSKIEKEEAQSYKIKTVIDRILSVNPTKTADGVNKYVFRNNAEQYATEESPEFAFTGKHLFEVMLDIASYKKMFPALYKNEIYFRPFWNGITMTSDDLPPPTKAVLNSAIDQYCTSLDSYVENMVCVNDSNVGTVVEPYAGGYISARSSGGSAISETSAIIPTQSPIYKPITLSMGDIKGEKVKDIIPYVYEQEDYDALYDTSAAYPYSKAYALKYMRFSKNYTELGHRIDTADELAAALERPAISNIIYLSSEGDSDVGLQLRDFLSGFIEKKEAAPFADLLFQPAYIPVVNARVRQYKPMFSTEDYEATLFYNQQAEVVDSEAFGEHVKGLVQKLGNHTEIRVYRFEKVDDIPTVGTLIDEKSVYNVAMTIYENHVDATLCLVDYAELSTYIGVKNEIKTSDISSTKWCNRFINWEEFFVFTHEAYTGNTLSITKDALTDIVSFTTAEPLTCAMFTSYAESGDSIMTAFAPIKHLALGNSIYFQWEMLDNFAVGYKSEKAPSEATSVWTGTQYDRAQRAVRYCDSFGRMETLDFQLLKKGPTPENSSWLLPEKCVTWTVDESIKTITFKLNQSYPCRVIVWFQGLIVDPYSVMPNLIFEVGQTEATYSQWGWSASETTLNVIRLYTGTEEDKKLAQSFMQSQIAHAYPQKPNELQFYPSTDETNLPVFEILNLLVKKDSAEALTFAMQYHFRQTWPEFIIGSGMSNFCSLIGGSCSQLQFFISSNFINRFERHVKLPETDDSVYKLLPDSPTFTVEENALRVRIELPASVNDTIEGKAAKSWGLVGKDRNGNWQLIFGENKNSKEMSSEFDTTIYLVARRKNNEPHARATYKLSLADTGMHNPNISFAVYVGETFYGQNGDFEIPRGYEVTIKSTQNIGFYFVLDGASTWLEQGELFTFQLTKDMQYYVYDMYVDPNEPLPCDL